MDFKKNFLAILSITQINVVAIFAIAFVLVRSFQYFGYFPNGETAERQWDGTYVIEEKLRSEATYFITSREEKLDVSAYAFDCENQFDLDDQLSWESNDVDKFGRCDEDINQVSLNLPVNREYVLTAKVYSDQSRYTPRYLSTRFVSYAPFEVHYSRKPITVVELTLVGVWLLETLAILGAFNLAVLITWIAKLYKTNELKLPGK